MFNTPDLLDQGTFNAMRYPIDMSVKDFTLDSAVPGAVVTYLNWQYNVTSNIAGVITINCVIANDRANNEPFPQYSGNIVSNSGTPVLLGSPTVAADTYRNAAGTFTVVPGNSIQYRVSGFTVSIFNVTTSATLNLFSMNPLSLVNTSRAGFNRLYVTAGVLPEDIAENDYNIIALPPLTQSDMYQQNNKCTIRLAKETNGVYLPGCIAQPVFNVTHASSYRKVLLTTSTTSVIDLLTDASGWSDTLDTNFMASVVNFQGIPYACKPLFKASRSIEFVPSAESILGLFVTGCPTPQPEAIEVCKAFTDNQPHGYPANWNGLGTLFGKVLGVVERIPSMLRAGHNIYREVKNVCDQEAIQEAGFSTDELLSQGFKRLMRVR